MALNTPATTKMLSNKVISEREREKEQTRKEYEKYKEFFECYEKLNEKEKTIFVKLFAECLLDYMFRITIDEINQGEIG